MPCNDKNNPDRRKELELEVGLIWFRNRKLFILSDKLAKAIENVSEDNAKAISKGLFRYAVQLEMLMRVIAKTNHFTDEELEDMRREAVNNVRRTRGKIKLEDIAKGWYNEE